MEKLFIAVMLLALVSCEHHDDVESTSTSVSLGYGVSLQVIKIESCQYLYGDWGNATTLTHKGNCNNPVHRLN